MPYAPGISYHGDQYLFQGISSAGQSLGEGIDQAIQRGRQLKAMRAMAVDGLGMDPDQVDGMSLPQLQGTLAGEALKRSNLGQQLQQQLTQSETEKNQMASTLQRYRQSAYAKFTDMVNQVTKSNPEAALDTPTLEKMGLQAGLDPQDFRQLMGGGMYGARAGYYGDKASAPGFVPPPATAPPGFTVVPKADGSWEMMRSPDAGTPEANSFVEDPVTGARFLTRGKQVLPSGENPALGGQAQEVTDETGNVVGHTVRAGNRTVFQPLKGAVDGQLRPVKDANGNILKGFGMDSTGKIHDFRTTMEKTSGNIGADPAPVSTKTPTGTNTDPWRPQSQADYDKIPSGDVYMDNGVLRRKK